MKTTTKIFLLGITLVAMMLLAGCSGSGVALNKLTGGDLRTLSADHLSAVQLFFGWLGVLYQRQADSPSPNSDFLPDGTIRMSGNNSDGSEFEWLIAPDTSSRGTIAWPDGTRFTQVSDATAYGPDWLSTTDHVMNTYPNGATIETTIVGDYDDVNFRQTWNGTIRLPGGVAMNFALDRVDGDRDQLRLELPDGSVFTLLVPTRNDLDHRPTWPRYAEGATGTFTAPGRGATQLQIGAQSLPDDDGVWNQWQFTAADGTQGSFALSVNSSGTGQLQQGGQPVGALRWTEQGLGTLDLLGAGVEEVTPSAAARDFRLDQWVRNTALLGPAPVY
jgi:hypothetical protein